MTREEAIDRLMWLKDVPHINDDKWIEAIDMAIEALTELKMREQYNQNYETDEYVKFGVTNKNKDKVILYDAFGEKEYYPQKTTPTIPMFKESEEAYKAWTGEEMGGRPKGEWIKNDDFICSECGCHMIVGDGAYNFCPNCGADMKGEE